MKISKIFSDNHLAIQQTSFTCEPTALLNALRLKGDFSHTEEELARLCDAKEKFGTTKENLVKAAREVGLDVIEEKSHASVEDIQRNLGQHGCQCWQSAVVYGC